jgi:hypothetical protein
MNEGYRSGRSAQGAPVRNTHRTPFRTDRRLFQGRPRRSRRLLGFGISGSRVFHCSSVRSRVWRIPVLMPCGHSGAAPGRGRYCGGRDDHRWSPPAQIRTGAFTHTALTPDGWRQSVRRDKDAAHGVEESTGTREGRDEPSASVPVGCDGLILSAIASQRDVGRCVAETSYPGTAWYW